MRPRNISTIAVALAVAALLAVGGCSSIINSHTQKETLLDNYVAGRNDAVVDMIKDKLSSSVIGSGDEVMWRLEAGAAFFNAGHYTQSIDQFRSAEEQIANYDARAIVSMRDAAAEGAMAVTNLNALPYRGLCRDRMALSIYKSLAYLGVGNESAFRAQIKRLRDEQKKVQEDYEKFFAAEKEQIEATRRDNPAASAKANPDRILNNKDNSEFKAGVDEMNKAAHRGYGNFLNPMAIFLSGLRSVRDNDYENGRIDFDRLLAAMPKSRLIQQYCATVTAKSGRNMPEELRNVKPFDFPLDRDCVYLIFANGRSAALRQVAIYFPIMTAWPVCEYYPAPYRELTAVAAGRQYTTSMLADMDGILSQEFSARLTGIIVRTVLSTAIKEAGKYAATYAASQYNSLAGVGVFIGASIYTALMNTADTRSWEMLPKEFQLTQFPMPSDRRVKVRAGNMEKTVTLPPECRSAFIFVSAPGPGLLNCRVLPFTSK